MDWKIKWYINISGLYMALRKKSRHSNLGEVDFPTMYLHNLLFYTDFKGQMRDHILTCDHTTLSLYYTIFFSSHKAWCFDAYSMTKAIGWQKYSKGDLFTPVLFNTTCSFCLSPPHKWVLELQFNGGCSVNIHCMQNDCFTVFYTLQDIFGLAPSLAPVLF